MAVLFGRDSHGRERRVLPEWVEARRAAAGAGLARKRSAVRTLAVDGALEEAAGAEVPVTTLQLEGFHGAPPHPILDRLDRLPHLLTLDLGDAASGTDVAAVARLPPPHARARIAQAARRGSASNPRVVDLPRADRPVAAARGNAAAVRRCSPRCGTSVRCVRSCFRSSPTISRGPPGTSGRCPGWRSCPASSRGRWSCGCDLRVLRAAAVRRARCPAAGVVLGLDAGPAAACPPPAPAGAARADRRRRSLDRGRALRGWLGVAAGVRAGPPRSRRPAPGRRWRRWRVPRPRDGGSSGGSQPRRWFSRSGFSTPA